MSFSGSTLDRCHFRRTATSSGAATSTTRRGKIGGWSSLLGQRRGNQCKEPDPSSSFPASPLVDPVPQPVCTPRSDDVNPDVIGHTWISAGAGQEPPSV